MAYQLLYTKHAINDIARIDVVAKNRIGKKLLLYTKDPLRHAVKLTDSSLGSYRFRIGDWRVIFDLRDRYIVVLRVGHRKDIYR